MEERTLRRSVLAALAATLLATVLAGCGGERSIVGEWSGEDGEGNRMTFVFREGGEADWILAPTGTAAAETIGMRWEADPSATPHHIDLSGFEEGPLAGLTMVGIYEFTGEDAFRIDLEPVVGEVEPDSARPDAFSEQTVVFTRDGAGR